ncbi:MAG: hypothetical protein ACFCUI_11775 [Bernardetiaceae bacterium]
MKQKHTYRRFIFWVIPFLVGGCIAEPNYSNVPFIRFNDIANVPGSINNLDSVRLTIDFQDGDGDLGLSPSNSRDTLPPFQSLNPDGTPNKFSNNIFVEIEVLRGDVFEKINLLDNQNFNGRFPPLNTLGRPTPLEGTIRYTLGIFYGVFGSPLKAGDQIRLIVQIADRSLNESNPIETPTITLGQYD